MDVMKEAKFCEKCGKKLVVTYRDSKKFNIITGKSMRIKTIQCPDYRAGQPFGSGHSCFISEQ